VASGWFLFFSYHNDAQSNKHQMYTLRLHIVLFCRTVNETEFTIQNCHSHN